MEIIFDRRMINYEELLAIFWQVTDPTDAFGQFQDRGNQYRSIIFVENEEQKILAEKSKHLIDLHLSANVYQVISYENYHQQFYKKQQKRYKKIKKSHQQFLFFKRAKKKWSGGDE